MGQFGSWHDFFWMSGHGIYVWSVYAITFATIAWQALGLRQQRQRTLKAIARAQLRSDV
jgi:heme exporter protein CcmD